MRTMAVDSGTSLAFFVPSTFHPTKERRFDVRSGGVADLKYYKRPSHIHSRCMCVDKIPHLVGQTIYRSSTDHDLDLSWQTDHS